MDDAPGSSSQANLSPRDGVEVRHNDETSETLPTAPRDVQTSGQNPSTSTTTNDTSTTANDTIGATASDAIGAQVTPSNSDDEFTTAYENLDTRDDSYHSAATDADDMDINSLNDGDPVLEEGSAVEESEDEEYEPVELDEEDIEVEFWPDFDDDERLSGSEDSSDAGASDVSVDSEERQLRRIITFNQAAPAEHSYLGENMEDVQGRVIYDEGTEVVLPAHVQRGVVLIPGQTLPLFVSRPSTVSMLRTVVNGQKTIAVLSYKPTSDDGVDDDGLMVGSAFADVGTTAEIMSISNEPPGRFDNAQVVKAITKGRQRFQVLSVEGRTGGVIMAKVRILRELKCSDPLDGAIPPSHYRPRATYNVSLHKAVRVTPQGPERKRRIHSQCCYFTHWPDFVYSQYDPATLMQRLKAEIKQWGHRTFNIMDRVNCPDQLAYWIAYNIPMSDRNKLRILSLQSSIQRLRYELHLLQQYTCLLCRDCSVLIAKKSDVFSLSYEGPMGTFVNPHGCVHETLTLHRARNLTSASAPTAEFSWFPGYEWTVLHCRSCYSHKGWKFTSDSLQPKMFYGLTRSSLLPGLLPDSSDSRTQEQLEFQTLVI